MRWERLHHFKQIYSGNGTSDFIRIARVL